MFKVADTAERGGCPSVRCAQRFDPKVQSNMPAGGGRYQPDVCRGTLC